MNPRRRDWRFWVLSLAALVGVAVTAALGRWQLSRATEREAQQAHLDAMARLAPVDASALGAAGTLHRRVVVRGTWISAHTVFLENRQMGGRPGFDVLTPLRLQGQPGVVLVQRGWAARDFTDRTALPRVPTPAGLVTVEGRISPAPGKLYDFAGASAGPIRQNLDLARFRAETGLPLLDVTVRQTGETADGLSRRWPAPVSGAERNRGYAFQWFGLSGLIAMLYVWFQIVRRFLASRRSA